jgi:hypothetical protein
MKIALALLSIGANAMGGDHEHGDHDHTNMVEEVDGRAFTQTEFSLLTDDESKPDYWLKGKYGTHINSDGSVWFDFVTELHANPSVQL